MSLEECIKQVSTELDIPYEVCRRAYRSAWKFMLENAQSQNFYEGMSMEEFRKNRPNMNVRGIGKLYVSEELFKRRIKKRQIIRKFKQEKHDKGDKND